MNLLLLWSLNTLLHFSINLMPPVGLWPARAADVIYFKTPDSREVKHVVNTAAYLSFCYLLEKQRKNCTFTTNAKKQKQKTKHAFTHFRVQTTYVEVNNKRLSLISLVSGVRLRLPAAQANCHWFCYCYCTFRRIWISIFACKCEQIVDNASSQMF